MITKLITRIASYEWLFVLVGALVGAIWLSTVIYRTAGIGGAILFFIMGLFIGYGFGLAVYHTIFYLWGILKRSQ